MFREPLDLSEKEKKTRNHKGNWYNWMVEELDYHDEDEEEREIENLRNREGICHDVMVKKINRFDKKMREKEEKMKMKTREKEKKSKNFKIIKKFGNIAW